MIEVKYKLIIDKNREESIVITAQEKSNLILVTLDLYCLTTESYIYDLASNIENVANLELKYFVLNEEWVELESSLYEFDELKTYELYV